MTISKEKPQYRDQLEEAKNVFTWAIRQSALTEMTKTVRDKTKFLLFYQLYALIRIQFTPDRMKLHSRADFFDLKKEPEKRRTMNLKKLRQQNYSLQKSLSI